MSYYSTNATNEKLSDILAQAKAIRYAMIHKAISYEEAKKKAEALLQVVNAVGEKISKRYGRKYRKIRFTDL